MRRTEPETSNSLKPFVTRSTASPPKAAAASLSGLLAALRSPGTVRASTRAAKSCHAYTLSFARTLTALSGSRSTANWRVASRRPLGLPSHRDGQLASVVLTALSPSCGTWLTVVSATGRSVRPSSSPANTGTRVVAIAVAAAVMISVSDRVLRIPRRGLGA
nr:hypothetical protein GCM10020092_023820 [Actinoplanes digitatis]